MLALAFSAGSALAGDDESNSTEFRLTEAGDREFVNGEVVNEEVPSAELLEFLAEFDGVEDDETFELLIENGLNDYEKSQAQETHDPDGIADELNPEEAENE